MIKSFLAKSGFAAKLPCLKEKIEFKPGLNVLFGPNGCGKTSMIAIMAAYCGIRRGGWTKIPEWSDIAGFGKNIFDFPQSLTNMTPGHCEAEVEWDGAPTYWQSAAAGDAVMTTGNLIDESDAPDGVTSMIEQVAHMMHKPSAGEYRQLKIKQMIEKVRNPPTFPKKPPKDTPDHMKQMVKGFLEYMHSGDQKGPRTILLDEVDRSLSIDVQVAMWDLILPGWAKHHQVIIASHSPVCLLRKPDGINWIDLQPGYMETSKKWLNGLIAGEVLFPEKQ